MGRARELRVGERRLEAADADDGAGTRVGGYPGQRHAPGAIRTEINRPAWETREAEARLLKLIPYGRVGDPDDVARAAGRLASDDSDYVVGTTLFVDRGMTLYPAFREGG